jgi:hypothetical protein
MIAKIVMKIVTRYKLQCDVSFTMTFLRFGNLEYTMRFTDKVYIRSK